MAQCNWDPKKHGGKPCPVHGGGGLWDENVFTRNEKLKKAGYTKEDLEDEDLKEDFDMDDEKEFKPTTDDLMEELSDNEYVYKGLDEKSIYNLMSERLSKKYDTEITSEEVAKNLKEGGFTIDEYNKSLEDDFMGNSEENFEHKSENENHTISNLDFQKRDEKFEKEVVDTLKEAVESNNNWIKKYEKLIESNKENKTMINDFTKRIEAFKKENDYFNSVIKNPELMYKK